MPLRQLADKIGFAYGHLSDLERGIKPPPSERKIIKIADALGIQKDDLLQSARKVDPQVTDYVSGQPKAVDFLRTAQERGFSNGDWEKLKKIAELSNLGRAKQEEDE